MEQLAAALDNYLEVGGSVARVLVGGGKSTCLSLCFKRAMDRRTSRTLILRAVAKPSEDIWTAMMRNVESDNPNLLGALCERLRNIDSAPPEDISYLRAAQPFIEKRTASSLDDLLYAHTLPNARAVVLIDQWNLVDPSHLLGKARAGNYGLPGFYLYAPSGTWDSQRCDRVPLELSLRIPPLRDVECCRPANDYLFAVTRDETKPELTEEEEEERS